MKQPSVYLKMRVLGAVDTVEGKEHGIADCGLQIDIANVGDC